MKIFKIEKAMKIKEYLKEIQGFSSRSMRQIIITVNKKQVKSVNTQLRIGDILTIKEKLKKTNLEPKELDFEIIYEDQEILVVNKDPFLLTHPTTKKSEITLAQGIYNYFLKKNLHTIPRFYNRLDMNTSGLIIITKSAYAQNFLQKTKIFKYYYALVSGNFEEKEFIIDGKIYKPEHSLKRIIDERGKESKTKITVIKENLNLQISLVRVELCTGRTHQIRVHLSSIGHPILGDSMYGLESVHIKRQLLHSSELKFINPYTKAEINLFASLPDDMNLF